MFVDEVSSLVVRVEVQGVNLAVCGFYLDLTLVNQQSADIRLMSQRTHDDELVNKFSYSVCAETDY